MNTGINITRLEGMKESLQDYFTISAFTLVKKGMLRLQIKQDDV